MRLKRYIFRRNIRKNIRAAMEALERENRDLKKQLEKAQNQKG
jgi:hypothetical protein